MRITGTIMPLGGRAPHAPMLHERPLHSARTHLTLMRLLRPRRASISMCAGRSSAHGSTLNARTRARSGKGGLLRRPVEQRPVLAWQLALHDHGVAAKEVPQVLLRRSPVCLACAAQENDGLGQQLAKLRPTIQGLLHRQTACGVPGWEGNSALSQRRSTARATVLHPGQ